MKNKNIKNKPQKSGRWLFLHSRVSKIFRVEDPRTPLINGIRRLNLQNLSSTTTAAKGKEKEPERNSPIRTIYKEFIIRLYRNKKKGGGRWGKIFFMWFIIDLFETSMCAIAEDKVCGSCIVSSWALLIFLLCLWWPNSNFLCCVITQNGESSRDLLLYNPAKTPSPHAPPPFKTLITLLPVTSHNSTRSWVLVGEKG